MKVQDFYIENCKLLLKEIKECLNKQKGTLSSEIWKYDIVKIPMLPQNNGNPRQISSSRFCRHWKADFKIHTKKERNLGAKKEKIKKKNTIGHSHFPISKLTTKLQLPRQCGTARHIDWWSRIENSDTSLYIDAQLVFDKGTYKGPDSIIFYFKSIISVFFLFMFCLFSPSANMPVQNPPCFYSNNKNL